MVTRGMSIDCKVVMEYCEFSVADILEYSLSTQNFSLTEMQIAGLCAVVVKGLAYLHQMGKRESFLN